MTTHYSLTEMIYAKAQVENAGTVCLWLGVRAHARGARKNREGAGKGTPASDIAPAPLSSLLTIVAFTTGWHHARIYV